MGLRQRLRARSDRGAVAVEGALVGCFILIPLLLGVLYYGQFFWRAQRVPDLDGAGDLPSAAAGSYTCQQLVDRLKSLLGGNVSSIATNLGVPASAVGFAVGAINTVPTANASVGANGTTATTSVGVTVTYTISVNVGGSLGLNLPLPNGGNVLQTITETLPNTSVGTASC